MGNRVRREPACVLGISLCFRSTALCAKPSPNHEVIMSDSKARIGILGASGYTGNEALRILLDHPRVEIKALTADRHAGKTLAQVWPQFTGIEMPSLVKIDEVDIGALDLVFAALPHGTTQTVIKSLLEKRPELKIVDISADFRLSDPVAYEKWYGHGHQALELQKEAVYGLTELYRDEIKKARLVANPGCYTTCAQLPLIPLLKAKAIESDEIVIDAKSGTTGAGRSAKEAMLFSEVSEGFNAYGVGHHRHMAELDQEFSKAAGKDVTATFTPHLLPTNRGIYSTIYVRGRRGKTARELHELLSKQYEKDAFVYVLPFGKTPDSRHVRGSNMTFIGVAEDRKPGRAIIVSTLDNLTKGASGQAVQNMNVMFGFAETLGIDQPALSS